MRAWIALIGVPLAVALAAADVFAEPDWTYRARVAFEVQGARTNALNPFARPGDGGWNRSSLFVVAADSAWESGSLRLAGGLLASGSPGTGATLQAREMYARISVAPWMDLEAGKRLVRWGVGYGFSPTGVLDPPRSATDPTDRLGRNEGMPLVRADVFRGDTSVTVGVASPALWRSHGLPTPASRVVAARVRTVLRGGVELAFVGSLEPDRPASVGGNITHVVGQRLEWHAELLARDRSFSAVAGFQYTLPGVNVVMEYHRHGTSSRPDATSGNVFFLRAARAGADARILPELIVIRAVDDGTWTAVGGLGCSVGGRLALHARGTILTGGATSRARLAPVSSILSAGATMRF